MENLIQKKYSIYIREVFEEVSKDIILPLYGNLSKTQISIKSNKNDLVTEADKLAEIFIKSKLNILSENFNFIGEESYNNDTIKEIKNSNSLFTWTCDPIDGTFNFVNNEEKFCIMISLCKSKIPIFSWLYFPIFEIFCYSNISEIILEHKNNKLSINRQNQKINFVQIFGSSSFLDNLFTDFYTYKDSLGYLRAKDIKCAGFEVIALACNKIDYLIHNNLTPWDHSPVFNFANSSGCKVVLNKSSEKFKFDSKGQLLCASSNLIYNKLVNSI